MESRYKIVRLMADGRFHSGEELAAVMGVSRASVWKTLKQVKEQLGINLFAVRGKGYRLAQPLELLDSERIRSALDDKVESRVNRLEVHDRIDSTNSYLMGRATAEGDSGSVCFAELQTAGRGRRGREWVSPYGSNIYLSINWVYPLAPADLSGLSLAAGIVVVRALESLGVAEVGLKWPNDILWESHKLAGLLLEVTGEHAGPSRVVLGLGLNTMLTEEDGDAIDQPWVDLASVPGGRGISRNRLAAELVNELIEMLAGFERDGLAVWVDEWKRLDLYHGKSVSLLMGKRTIEGIHKGIDSSGALLLEHEGQLQAYHGGEVSLRAG